MYSLLINIINIFLLVENYKKMGYYGGIKNCRHDGIQVHVKKQERNLLSKSGVISSLFLFFA